MHHFCVLLEAETLTRWYAREVLLHSQRAHLLLEFKKWRDKGFSYN